MKDLVQKAKELIQRLCLTVKAEWPSFKRLVELVARLVTKKISNDQIPAAKAESLALLSQTKTILTLITCAIVILLLRGCGDSSASVRRDKYEDAAAKELKRIQELNVKIEESKKHEFVCSVDGVKYTYIVLEGYANIVRSNASGDVRIPATLDGKPVNNINDNAFYGCSELTSIVVPNGVKWISKHAFRNCTKLRSATIPGSVITLSDGVFKGCTSLRSVELSEGLSVINNSVFEGCTSLESITIPNSVDVMLSRVFKGCTNLKSVVLSKNLGCVQDEVFRDCTRLKTVTWPQGGRSRVRWVFDQAFQNCSSLEAMPDGLTGIGLKKGGSFMGCSRLTTANLASEMKRMALRA